MIDPKLFFLSPFLLFPPHLHHVPLPFPFPFPFPFSSFYSSPSSLFFYILLNNIIKTFKNNYSCQTIFYKLDYF